MCVGKKYLITPTGRLTGIVSIAPVFDDKGTCTHLVGSVHDITLGRKRAEDALKKSEDKYRSILENIEEGYFEVDLNGNFTFFNDSLCRLLGYSREELMGMNNRQYTEKNNQKYFFKRLIKFTAQGNHRRIRLAGYKKRWN